MGQTSRDSLSQKEDIKVTKSEVNVIPLDQNFAEIYPDKSNSGTCNSTRFQFH